jgi:hypothetical protein
MPQDKCLPPAGAPCRPTFHYALVRQPRLLRAETPVHRTNRRHRRFRTGLQAFVFIELIRAIGRARNSSFIRSAMSVLSLARAARSNAPHPTKISDSAAPGASSVRERKHRAPESAHDGRTATFCVEVDDLMQVRHVPCDRESLLATASPERFDPAIRTIAHSRAGGAMCHDAPGPPCKTIMCGPESPYSRT